MKTWLTGTLLTNQLLSRLLGGSSRYFVHHEIWLLEINASVCKEGNKKIKKVTFFLAFHHLSPLLTSAMLTYFYNMGDFVMKFLLRSFSGLLLMGMNGF